MPTSAVAMDDIAMLTMLLPTRIVTSRRCGSFLSDSTVFAPGTPSSTSASTRCFASENIAISDEEKNAESKRRTTMVMIPRPE